MTKRYCFAICFSFLVTFVFAQTGQPYTTLQRVIPPSPEAISLGQVGFSDVNLYTGKAGYSLPLYTVQQNGISFPISLSYTGGGGIKIEELASSVGLGWNLSSTGVVTRVIRGVADDLFVGNYIGYVHLPEFPPLADSNLTVYNLYADNKYDGQPDLYSVNAAGISAQFYINKSKKVVFVEKSDLAINPIFSGYELMAFEVKDLNGNKYYFSELEKSKSIGIDNAYEEYNLYNTSSWYLTKITTAYGKEAITFSYLNGEYNQIQQENRAPHQYSTDETFFSSSNTDWFRLYYKRPVLQKIAFAAGEVNFIMSDSVRYDLGNDKSLDSIVIKNYLGDTVKQVQFKYSYFSPNGTIQQGQGTHAMFGNPALRLKLDSLQEISRTNEKLTYRFSYDTSHYLPDRMASFAVDHWGYYNGESNTVWEAKNRVKYYQFVGFLDSFYAEFGTANRNPSLEYAKSGILKKVIQPTGGQLQFEYELNSSTDAKLPNQLVTPNFFANLGYVPNYFNVELINEPFAYLTVYSSVTNSSYSYEYIVTDSLQNYIYFHDTLVSGDYNHIYKVKAGPYCIKVKILGSHPDPNYQYFARVYYEKEQLIVNKPVGGVRIRSMNLVDPVGGATMQRNYYYNESGDTSVASPSTGKISGVPKYGYQYIVVLDPASWGGIPGGIYAANGYIRQISSFYPLGVTSGSFVGYSKVTVVDSNALKTESYFTGFDDFPEMADGYWNYSLTNEDGMMLSGKWHEVHPLTPPDERDHLRGKLIKQIVYKKENGSFSKIQQTENTYQFNMGFVLNDHTRKLPEAMDYLTGMAFLKHPIDEDVFCFSLKKYNLYTTRYDLIRTIEKQYSYQGGVDSMVSESYLEYGDSPWFRDSLFHYQPTKLSKKTSTTTETTWLYYPYDWRYTIPDADTLEVNKMKILEAGNRIGVPVLQISEDSTAGVHISSVKNTYSELAGSSLAVNFIKTKQAAATSFESRLSFNKYDTLGNLLEQQKTQDVKNSFIWDYKNTHPVAEVTNAGHDEIAYTSFEADGKGGWTFSGSLSTDFCPTGKKCYLVSGGNITKSGLSSNTYTVSYWGKNGSVYVNGQGPSSTGKSIGAWRYYEHELTTTTITVSGSNYIDELRLYPKTARMTTYTYQPLVGMTSQCDANNRIIYYEFDSFGKLIFVRDSDRKLVKKICYNYQGQPENCQTTVYTNVQLSQNFTRNNCGTGYTGGTVNYTVPAGTYFSSISQADADAMAQWPFNANGQAYANANGTCTCDVLTCTGPDKKCIYNTCYTGTLQCLSTVFDRDTGNWLCDWYYVFTADCSAEFAYTTTSASACSIFYCH